MTTANRELIFIIYLHVEVIPRQQKLLKILSYVFTMSEYESIEIPLQRLCYLPGYLNYQNYR